MGKLFDEVTKTKSGGRYRYPNEIELDPDLICDNFENFLERAKNMKKEYNADLLKLMRKFQIQDESEAVSGCLLKVPNLCKNDKLAALRELQLGKISMLNV